MHTLAGKEESIEWFRELWIRLAQMEAEKLKAVELAVEEERRRVAEKKVEERRAVEQEREEAERVREEARVEREAGRAALQVALCSFIVLEHLACILGIAGGP